MDLKQMETAINEELLNISKWLKANKLSLNVKKNPHYMIFTRRRHIDSNINLSIDGESICEVQKK